MREILECLVNQLNTNSIVKPLINKVTLTFSITCDSEYYFIEFKENHFWSITTTNKLADVLLSGEKKELIKVLNGEVLLRAAKNQGSIALKGPLRKILLLESLYVLTSVNGKYSNVSPK